jgi:hypothetical protein
MPTLIAHKIKDSTGAIKWCANTYTHNIKAVVDKSEVEERQRAKGKSTTAGDKSGTESAAGGLEAKAFWSERKQLLLTAAPYFDDSFAERFITVALDPETGMPSEATIAEMRESLKCAAPTTSQTLALALSPWISLLMRAFECEPQVGRLLRAPAQGLRECDHGLPARRGRRRLDRRGLSLGEISCGSHRRDRCGG